MKPNAFHLLSFVIVLVAATPVSGQVLTSHCSGCDATFTSTYDSANCTIEYKVLNNNFSDDICFLLEGIPFGQKSLDDGVSAENTLGGIATVTAATSTFCCGAEMIDPLVCANCDDFLCSAVYHKPTGAKISNSYDSTLEDTLATVTLQFDSLRSGNTVTYRVTNHAATPAVVTWSGTPITNQSVAPGAFVQAAASGTTIVGGFAQVLVNGSVRGQATTHLFVSTVPSLGRFGFVILIVLALIGGAVLVARKTPVFG